MTYGPAPFLFIVGSPRTGSTLLRHVLNRSPEVCLASETHYLKGARQLRLPERLATARTLDGKARREAVRSIVADLFSPRFWIWLRRKAQPDAFLERLLATDLTDRALLALLLEVYAELQCPDRTGAVRGEKTPDHLYAVETLAEWFPGARFLHTFRDPRAIYASRLVRSEEGRRGMKARLPAIPDRVLDPVLAPIEVVETSRVWLDAARLHRRYAAMLGDRYRLVQFEQLVGDPEGNLRAICEFVGIQYQPALLEDTVVIGSSFADERHAAQGFDRQSVDRWRKHVNPLVKAWFGVVARRELRRFGYRP